MYSFGDFVFGAFVGAAFAVLLGATAFHSCGQGDACVETCSAAGKARGYYEKGKGCLCADSSKWSAP